MFFEGEQNLVGGTSASAPTIAGFVSLLNDARIRAGKSSLGFLNPLIYSVTALHQSGAFNDITQGTNPGCGTPGFNVSRLHFCLSSCANLVLCRLLPDGTQ